MQKLLATLTLAAMLATFGCNKKQDQNADQNANPNAAPAGQTMDNSQAPSGQNNQASSQAPAPATAPAPMAAPAPPPPPPPPPPIVVPAGTSITITTSQALSSKTSEAGNVFTGSVTNSVSVGGKVAIPAGSDAQGTVVTAKAKGKIKGQGVLELQLTQVTIKGRNYPIQTGVWSQTEKGKGKRTAVTTGGGAALGAIIGGIAGGGKGAAIGAGVGGGAGFAGGALTGNKQIELPAESALTFSLSSSLTIEQK
jgi:hypothetical protein